MGSKYYEQNSNFKKYGDTKNAPFDIELNNNDKVSVKTITEWSSTGYGTQIKPLCGKNWQILAAVFLNKNLLPAKIAIVSLDVLIEHEPFVLNKINREKENGTKSYPRFQLRSWLDEYVIYSHESKNV